MFALVFIGSLALGVLAYEVASWIQRLMFGSQNVGRLSGAHMAGAGNT